MTFQMEAVPRDQQREPQPEYGGVLFVNTETGKAGCQVCGWSGVPTTVEGITSSWCPACQHDPDELPPVVTLLRRETTKVERNAPCPCGSGRKAKKCCYR